MPIFFSVQDLSLDKLHLFLSCLEDCGPMTNPLDHPVDPVKDRENAYHRIKKTMDEGISQFIPTSEARGIIRIGLIGLFCMQKWLVKRSCMDQFSAALVPGLMLSRPCQTGSIYIKYSNIVLMWPNVSHF